jgi:hypothetical protein
MSKRNDSFSNKESGGKIELDVFNLRKDATEEEFNTCLSWLKANF